MGAFSLLLVRKLQLEKSPHESWFFRQRAVNQKKTKSQHKKSDSAPIAVWDCMWLRLTAKQTGMLTQLLGLSSFFYYAWHSSFFQGRCTETVTTGKDRSLKCIAPGSMASPDLCGRCFLLLGAACFLQNVSTEVIVFH